jgi:hypothetical protein
VELKTIIMKYLFICLFILCLIQPSFGKKVDEKDVLKVVEKVLKNENKDFKKIDELIPSGLENDTTIYIAKLKDGGFIIVSADDAAPPYLGGCTLGEYNPKAMPPGLLYLIEKYKYVIKSIQEDNIHATDKIKSKWKYYLDDEEPNLKSVSTITTNSYNFPLIKTHWDQSYNSYCPTGCPAGCEAIAMAQILYYWSISVDPTGSNTYDGQTANFGGTTYCWVNMALSTANSSNELLIYHAGVSCNTDYETERSGATLGDTEDAYETFWGMNADLQSRFWHLSTWEDDLKEQLDNGVPVHYRGTNFWGNAGHAWVIDGYNESDQFHCNWGWGLGYDSDYNLGDFYLAGNNLNYSEQAIFDLFPQNYFNPGNISGPATLGSTSATYSITNPASYAYLSWTYSSNIQSVYGGNDWIALRATSSGTGWIEASYNFSGYEIPVSRIYVTLTN